MKNGLETSQPFIIKKQFRNKQDEARAAFWMRLTFLEFASQNAKQ